MPEVAPSLNRLPHVKTKVMCVQKATLPGAQIVVFWYYLLCPNGQDNSCTRQHWGVHQFLAFDAKVHSLLSV